MAPRRSPLLTFSSVELQSAESSIVFNPQSLEHDPNMTTKRWYHYLPLCGEPYEQTLAGISYYSKWLRHGILDSGTSPFFALRPRRFPLVNSAPTRHICYPFTHLVYPHIHGFVWPYCMSGKGSRSCECTALPFRRSRWRGRRIRPSRGPNA